MDIRNNQIGAVMAEFLIAVGFLLVPLILFIPILSKYIETKQYVEQAARYSAWERTTWYKSAPKYLNKLHGANAAVKSDSEIQFELQNRILSSRDTMFYDQQKTNRIREEINPMLQVVDQTQDGKKIDILKMQFEQNKNKYALRQLSADSKTKGIGGSFENTMTGAIKTLAPNFSLNLNGQYSSDVSVEFAELKKYKALGLTGLTMGAKNVLLAEGWTAGGPDYARAAVGDLNPLGRLAKAARLDSMMNWMSWFPFAESMKHFDMDKVTIEPVPCARLSDNRGRTPSRCRRYR